MKDLNQYLQKRGDRWHYVRRVPNEFSDIDTRSFIRKSLKTESLELARLRRDDLIKADNAYWAKLKTAPYRSNDPGRRAVQKTYEKAQSLAIANGFAYSSIQEIAESNLEDILKRVKVLESAPGNIASKELSDAVLGTVNRPKTTISQAFEIYCNKIAASDLIGMSPSQQNSWRKSKFRAIKNFIAVNGDLNMSEIERKHGRKLYSWWADRISPASNEKPLSPYSGNRDLGNLHKLFRDYWDYEGEDDRENPFRNLRFTDKVSKETPPFEDEWVRSRILKPGIFEGLNQQAAIIAYVLIETGCRPSEIANLIPENIRLNEPVPHIRIRSTGSRQLKSKSSKRDIPLVGVSLAAMRNAPNGFPHYRDKESLLSASLMKAFRTRGLFPTPNHRIYSFRHSFEKRMLEADIDYGLRCTLMGHSNNRPSYGDGGSLEYRRNELLKIVHPFEF